jgi:hypothetical protein
VNLVIDESSRQVRQFICPCCATEAERTWTFVYAGDTALAAYFATCYHHDGVHEAWIDAILGTWGQSRTDDHVTFGCRVGPVQNSPAPAATLVDGGSTAPDEPLYGQKLTREQGLAHPRIGEFWQLVDTILEQDSLVRQHVYGPSAS